MLKKTVTYNIIFPDNEQQPVSTKATKCKPLYYEKLIRVVCYANGKWVWKKDDWEYKGKNLIFDHVVNAYYQSENK